MAKITLKESYSAIQVKQLIDVENKIGIHFPEAYRKFLLRYNGGRPEPNVFPVPDKKYPEEVDWFLGIHNGKSDNLLDYHKSYKGRIPEELLPIAHDSGGNLILIGVQGFYTGKIYFWDHEQEAEEDNQPYWGNIMFVSNSLDEFMDSFKELEV